MPRRLRMERRIERCIDLVLVTLLCLVMAGCLVKTRREQKPDPKRVVYLGITNAPPAIDQAVADRVDPGYERVSADEYRETARKLNAEGMIDLDVARVAQALGADVIIHGEYVRKNRRRGQLTVTMRTAAIGAVVGEYVIPVRRGAITKRGARRLDSELRAELEALLGPPEPAPVEPASAVATTETAPAETAPASGDTAAQKPASAQAAPVQAAPKPARTEAAPAQASKPARAEAVPAQAASKPARAEVAPAQAASKPARAEAVPAQAASKPARAEAAPAETAPKPARGAKATGQPPRASEEPARSGRDVARNQPEPKAPAPTIQQDDSGQVIDDEKPPKLK